MSMQEPPTAPVHPEEVWRPLTDDELYGTPPLPPPPPRPRELPFPHRRRARGFDDNLKVGAVLLVLSLVILPIVFGPGAAYCGYRSHRRGNPAGLVFSAGAAIITVLNFLFLLAVVVPRYLNV